MKAIKLLFLLSILYFVCACQSTVKKEVVVRFVADPESLNPVGYSSANATQIVNLMYQSLLAVDLQDNQLKPVLAERLPEVVKKGNATFITYQLRKEAAWDSINPITGRDVAFTLKVIKTPLVNSESWRLRLGFIRDIKIDSIDAKRFTIECAGYAPEMNWVSGDFAILPQHVVDPKHLLDKYSLPDLAADSESLSSQPDLKTFADWFNSARFTRDKKFLKGSGGYELADWKTGQTVKLRKKAFWWANQLNPQLSYITAQPNEINFQVMPESNTAMQALENEQLDVFSSVPASDFEQLRRNASFKEKYALFTPPTYDFTYIGINGRNQKFADKRTRQALAHLLDIPKIIKVTQYNLAVRTVGPVNPVDKEFYNSQIRPYAFNLRQATDLLRAAGWQQSDNGWHKIIDGERTPLTITFNYRAGNPEFESIALIFQQAAAGISIPVTIQPVEGLILTDNLKKHQFEVFIRYLSGNPFVFDFKPLFHSESAQPGGQNFTGFGNAQSDQLIEAINQEDNKPEKAALLQRLQEIMHEESNLIFLYFNTDRIAVHKRFTNLKVSKIRPGYDVSAFTLKRN